MRTQRGGALLVMLMIASIATAYLLVSTLTATRQKLERDEVTAKALAQAKEALIGFAATYRDQPGHASQVFGYLPCPDTDNDGDPNPPCGGTDVSVIGRLPWKTLGLPALRDSAAECLWYAVSGRHKDNAPTPTLNWDTVGQFTLQDASGATLSAGGAHGSAVAVVFAPRGVTGAQTRTTLGNECGGNNIVANYLEGITLLPGAGAISTLTLGNAASVSAGTNNDVGQTITPGEIFDRIHKRGDFKEDVNTLLNDFEACLNSAPPPAASPGNKGMDNVLTMPACSTASWSARRIAVLNNWRDNLLYARPGGSITVNGDGSCQAALIFSGNRSATQLRNTPANRLLPANYLEGANLASFPGGSNYAGTAPTPTEFNPANPAADVVRCIKPGGSSLLSFASNFGNFVPAGVGVTTNASAQTVAIASAVGTAGGCFWSPVTLPLAGKTLRATYAYQFNQSDPVGGSDRGNGFTFSLLRGDLLPPIPCGTQANMGALDAASGWGLKSFIIESDVHLDAGTNDPVENHTAIMAHGNLTHAVLPTGNGYTTAACNGSAAGCRHAPANAFEEAPAPSKHNQRIEIHSGCNSACTVCNPPTHGAPNDYVRISAWVDCSGVLCSYLAADINRVSNPPTINRCIQLDPELNTVYPGFTGGFRSGAAAQSVTISGFDLRSE